MNTIQRDIKEGNGCTAVRDTAVAGQVSGTAGGWGRKGRGRQMEGKPCIPMRPPLH